MDFYDARDFAYEVGLMDDGELKNPPPDVDPAVVDKAFRGNTNTTIVAMANEAISLLKQGAPPIMAVSLIENASAMLAAAGK